jgi:hypothetical protein
VTEAKPEGDWILYRHRHNPAIKYWARLVAKTQEVEILSPRNVLRNGGTDRILPPKLSTPSGTFPREMFGPRMGDRLYHPEAA